jgi:CBS domain containing-hemolysin-like protein
MDPSQITRLVILVVLIILSGLFSSAETALTTVNINKLKALSEEGKKKADRVLRMRENPSKLLSTILVGNNIVNLSASALSTTLFTELFGSKAVGIVTGVLTFLILIFGEITPKTIANAHSLGLSMAYAYPISFLMIIFTPIIWILNIICRGIFRILGLDPDKDNDKITEKELRVIVSSSEEAGVIEQSEKKMITNVVDFGDAVSKDIMIPRADMVCAEITADYNTLLQLLESENYSRFPVYRESRDHIVGILHVKDMILYAEKHGRENATAEKVMRRPVYVYEYQRTAEIFKDMKTSSATMCIVLDEYGITAGLITMEDLIEEIVGEIRDEYDEGEAEWIKRLSEDHYSVDGAVKLDDLSDAIGTPLHSDHYDSLGGLVIELLDRLPDEGDEVENEQVYLKVKHVEKNRVERVEVIVKPQSDKSEEEAGE